MLEHSRVSTVHTQHTTPPPHTLFAKTPWAFTEDAREADMGAQKGVHCPHTANDTLSSLLSTPLQRHSGRSNTAHYMYSPSLYTLYALHTFTHTHTHTSLQLHPGQCAFMEDVREGDILRVHSRVSTVHTQHTTPTIHTYDPLHTPLYKNTLGVHSGCERTDTLCQTQIHHKTPPSIYTLHPSTQNTPLFKNTLGVHSGCERPDILRLNSRVSNTRHSLFISYTHPIYINTPLRPE